MDYSIPFEDAGATQIDGLGKRLSIRTSADGWSNLLARVQPTFAWNGCDMLWVSQDPDGQPKFILDEAYICQRPQQISQWVLLDENDDAVFDEYYGEVMGNNLRGVAKVRKDVPVSDNDGGILGDYAVVVSENPQFGTVYEIGWQQLTANGSCHCENNRHIYLYRDCNRQWHFLGEGPGVGNGRGGYYQNSSYDVTAQVRWLTNGAMHFPLEIGFICRNEDDFNPGDNDTNTYTVSRLVTFSDAVLNANTGHRNEMTGHPYLLAEKDDTLEKIVERLGFFEPAWAHEPDGAAQRAINQQIINTWRAIIIGLNPTLPKNGIIRQGTRVEIMSDGDVDELIYPNINM